MVVSPHEASVLVEVDPLALERIVTNLVGNAVKFTPDGGRIVVATRRQRAATCIDVIDTGPGIPPESLSTIFERYTQTEEGRVNRGTGLGLYIARTLAEAHGGTVHATSEMGRGSHFTVVLPDRIPRYLEAPAP